MVCLLLPLALVGAPARNTKVTAPLEKNAPRHQVEPTAPNLAPLTGRLSLPSPRQAIRQLRKVVTESMKPPRRSFLHVNLGDHLQLRVADVPHWTTTTPRAPRTFSFALLSLNW